MKRFVRNLTTSAEEKRENNIKHIRQGIRYLQCLRIFFSSFLLPVFPTPLPPITAILMARLGAEYSEAGYSAMVVMFWMRRIVFARQLSQKTKKTIQSRDETIFESKYKASF